jgi:hypothetical protein
MTRVLLSGYFETPEKFVFSARFVETCYERSIALRLRQYDYVFTAAAPTPRLHFLPILFRRNA